MTSASDSLTTSAGGKAKLSLSPVVLLRMLVVAGALGFWELSTRIGLVDPFWVSRPSAILPALLEFLSTADGWKAVAVTLLEALAGLAIGSFLGILSGFLITRSQTLKSVLNPFVAVLNSVPRLALTPLFIVWFGIGSFSKIVMVITLVYFILLVNTISAIESVDEDLKIVSRLMGATRRQLTFKVVIPSSVPWILAGLRVAMGNAFAGAVVAEMIAGQGGLGFIVSYAAGLLNLRDVFVAVILVMFLAYIADVLLLRLERRLLRWRPTGLRVGDR